MRRRQRNLGTKILSATLAAVMSLSLAMSPLPGMLADYEGEKVEAAISTGDEAEGVIYFPITLRDGRANTYFFQNNNAVLTSVIGAEVGHVKEYLNPSTRTPDYTEASKEEVAVAIKNVIDANGKTKEEDSNSLITNTKYIDTVLNNAIKAKVTDTATLNANSPNYDGSFGSIRNYYDAASWILANAFTDATLIDAPTTNPDEMFMYKDMTYNTLLLKKNIVEGTWDGSFSYSAKQAANATTKPLGSKLDEISGIIQNDASSDPMGWCGDAEKANYQYCGWYPLTGLGYESIYKDYKDFDFANRNFHFTVTGSGKFVYHTNDNLFFDFSGDDDVYLYVGKGNNAKLVVDLGGTHSDTRAYVELESKLSDAETNINVSRFAVNNANTDQTWAEYLGLKDGETYDFYFFHMERNKFGSNFSMRTNINVVNSAAYPEKTAYQNGVELDYGSYVRENSEVTYGFKMTNYSDSDCFGIKNLNFKDADLGITLSPNKSDIKLGSYNKEDGTTAARSIADLEYAIYPENTIPDYYTKISDLDQLAGILSAQLAQGMTFEIRGFKYNIGTGGNTKSFTNTITTSATGLIGNEASPYETTLQGSAKMKLNTTSFVNRVYVVDYAKPMDISIESVFTTKNAKGEVVNELNYFPNSKIKTIELEDGNGDYGQLALNTLKYENVGTINNISWGNIITDYKQTLVTYTPTAFISGRDDFAVKVTIASTPEEGTEPAISPLSKPISVIPANSVYYEDTFVSSDDTAENATSLGIVYNGNGWGTEGTEAGTNADNVGDGITPEVNKDSVNDADSVHGWEDALADDTQYSGGSAHIANVGDGKTASAKFTFTGTGVDIYSRTNMHTGTVFAYLTGTKDNGTKVNKALVVDQLAESNGDTGYYQIPTLWFKNLDHGTYTVEIIVTTAASGRYLYYLDGIRVYNPLSEADIPEGVEQYEDEKGSCYTSLRQWILGVETFTSDSTEATGAVFIDAVYEGQAGEDETGTPTVTDKIGTYRDFGPKNEVYLASGQSIAVKVDPSDNAHYYVGLKGPAGETKARVTGGVSGETNLKHEITIEHSTDLYYEVKPNSAGYIIITNSTTPVEGDLNAGLLSITNLRTTGLNGANGLQKVISANVTEQMRMFRSLPVSKVENKPVQEEIKVSIIESITNRVVSSIKSLISKIFAGFENWF